MAHVTIVTVAKVGNGLDDSDSKEMITAICACFNHCNQLFPARSFHSLRDPACVFYFCAG
jgi:hypothetical protein